ncbi:MAG: nucleoside triphosphate pyrophosphohydrolase [Tissierellia bacterium]|nr:nucleoside triphosphate pyrophosphohydrolase [Tissierellia bacterium]
MNTICIVGIGSTNEDDLTLKALKEIQSGKKLYARTNQHEVIKYIESLGIEVETFDSEYNSGVEIEETSENIVKRLIDSAREEEIVYLVPGGPTIGEDTVRRLIDREIDINLVAGLSTADTILANQKIVTDVYRVIDGSSLDIYDLNYKEDLIITEIDNELLLQDIKLQLLEVYPPESEVLVIKDSGLNSENVLKVKIYEIGNNIVLNHQTSIFIPKINEEASYNFNDALKITRRLRGEDRCKWDAEQTHESLRENLIEEAYEVVEAIDSGDIDSLVDELGDLLYQVLLHSEIGIDEGTFNVYDVTRNLSDKLIYRHPHVFLEKNVDNSEKLLYNWDRLKNESRNIHTFGEELRSIKGLPSTLRADKIISKAYKINFKWDDVSGVIAKVEEELREVRDALDGNGDIEEELGDLIFTVVNLVNYLGYSSELLLNQACEKFISRFEKMDELVLNENLDIRNLDLDTLDSLWNMAKNLIR